MRLAEGYCNVQCSISCCVSCMVFVLRLCMRGFSTFCSFSIIMLVHHVLSQLWLTYVTLNELLSDCVHSWLLYSTACIADYYNELDSITGMHSFFSPCAGNASKVKAIALSVHFGQSCTGLEGDLSGYYLRVVFEWNVTLKNTWGNAIVPWESPRHS